jgi:hypothetical protein
MTLSPRRPLFYVVYLALACRLLVPAGFMPAPLAEGGPLRLCPGGAAGALLEALAAGDVASSAQHDTRHRHHGHDNNGGKAPEQYDPWQYCPVGAVFASATLVGESSTTVLELEHFFAARTARILVSLARTGVYRARAPPLA